MAQQEEIVLNIKSDIGKVVKETEKLEGATKKGKKGFKGLGVAIKGVGSALKAAGIGIIVALLAKLMEVFSSNQKVLDAFDTGMTSLTMAFNDLFDFLSNNIGAFTGFFTDIFENPQQAMEDFGTAIQENLIERFTSFLEMLGLVGQAAAALFAGEFSKAGELVKEAGLEYVDALTGVDNAFDKTVEAVTTATDAVVKYSKKTWKAAEAVTATNKAAARAAVEFEKLNAQYLKDAEIQRQIRDDETKTFTERIEANKKLDKILEKQQKDQKKQIQTQIDAAQAQYNINENEENFIALEKEKVAMLQLEEAITGQLSEQKTNAVSLEKELLEAQKEIRVAGMSGLERELQELKDAYELKKKMADKSGSDIKKITEQYEKQKKAVVKANVDDQIEAYAGLANALIGLAGENKALAVASAIIDTFVGANKALGNAPPPLNYINMAAVVATGLANVSSIMQTDVPGGGGGGGSVSAPAIPPAPQMMSGAFELSGGIENEATRAYVVTDEMTNSQNQLANIRRRATI